MRFPVGALGEITFCAVSNSSIEAAFQMETITPVAKTFLFFVFMEKYVHCILHHIRVLSTESFTRLSWGTHCFLSRSKRWSHLKVGWCNKWKKAECRAIYYDSIMLLNSHICVLKSSWTTDSGFLRGLGFYGDVALLPYRLGNIWFFKWITVTFIIR